MVVYSSRSTAATSPPSVNRTPPAPGLRNLAPVTTAFPAPARSSTSRWILISPHNTSSSSMTVPQSPFLPPRWPRSSHRHALLRPILPISCRPSFASIPRLHSNTRDSITKDFSRRPPMAHIASSTSRISTRNTPTGRFLCPISPLIGRTCVWTAS